MTPDAFKERAGLWWRTKSVRDQRIVAATVLLLLVATWHQFAWLPLDQARKAARAEIRRLQAASQVLAQLPSQKADASLEAGDIQTLIKDGIADLGLVVSDMETRESKVIVRFENVAFDPLARWLNSVGGLAGIRIEAARIDRRIEPGTVSAEIELSLL